MLKPEDVQMALACADLALAKLEEDEPKLKAWGLDSRGRERAIQAHVLKLEEELAEMRKTAHPQQPPPPPEKGTSPVPETK